MARLIEFTVAGLAGRKDVYAKKLNEDINVFFGLNGSGKTSLLKILHSALSGDASILERVPFQNAEVKIFSVDYNKVFTNKLVRKKISVPQGLLSTTYPTKIIDQEELFDFTHSYFYSNIYQHSGKELLYWETSPKIEKKEHLSLSHQYLPTSRLWTIQGNVLRKQRITESETLFDEDQLDLSFQQSIEQLWTGYIREILTNVRKIQEEGLTNILKTILTEEQATSDKPELNADTAFDRVSRFLKRQGAQKTLGSPEDFNRRYSSSPNLKNVVSYIDRVETGIEMAMTPRNKLQSLIEKMFSGNKKVIFSDKSIEVLAEKDQRIGVASLSSGEKHALRILIETLYAESSPLLIDEPEISMHVDWQKELIPSMRSINPHAQLIIATHSPEIMAQITDDKIFRL